MRWRRARALVLLALAGSLLGFGAAPGASAQDDAPLATGEKLFGAYQLEARGVGVQARYELQDILPGGAPLLDLGIPETATRFATGPNGYGLAGLAYPGPLLADLGVLLAQTGAGSEDSVPPWPIKAEAFYPTGPTEVDESQGPAVQRVVTGDLGVQSVGSFPAVEAAPVLEVGSVRAATRSSIEGELAVSRTRVELGAVRLLNGLITIDSVVTDLVAAHDGQAGSTAGGTTVSGVRFLGLEARLDDGGLVLAGAPSDGPSDDPLGGLLGDLGPSLGEALGPVTDLLQDVLAQAVPLVDDLLGQAGITLEVAAPHETQSESGAATRISSGLTLRFSYEGTQQEALRDLLDAIPPDLKPSLGPVPNPLGFLVENHIIELSLAPGTVTALATPPFPAFEAPPLPPPAPEVAAPPPSGPTPDLGAPGFSTPIAPVPSPSSSGGPDAPSPLPAEPLANAASGAVPAILVVLSALAAPFFGLGSSRLADDVLAGGAAPCPFGLDQPPPSGGSP